MSVIPPVRFARMRLAAQRLVPETAAATAVEAARAVIGIQAQDVRASGLALRSRVPGVERATVDADPGLVRTWTVRGTVHLIAADDLPWLHALTGPRNRRYFDNLMIKRGNLDLARSILPDFVAILAEEGPLTKAQLLVHLSERGHRPLDQSSSNIVMPWATSSGQVLGLADGRFRAADPPPPVDEGEALAILGRRYLEGYGPAGAADLAKWSGLPVSAANRALAATETETMDGDLLSLPGTLDAEPPRPARAKLLAAFDTSMLGWRTREPLVRAVDDCRMMPGGGILRAVLLAGDRVVATWKLGGSGRRRTLEIDRFGRFPSRTALKAEAADVARFLGIEEIRLAE